MLIASVKVSTTCMQWLSGIYLVNSMIKKTSSPLLHLSLVYLAVLITLLFSSGCQKKADPIQKPVTNQKPQFTNQDFIVYTSGGKLYTTNLSAQVIQQLENTGSSNWFPAVSPDQTKIAFWSSQSGSYELWIYDLAASRPYRLTFFNDQSLDPEVKNFNIHNAPTWSPDGSMLAFSHAGKIWTIDQQGFNLETMVTEGVNFSPAWSPDNRYLAYLSMQNNHRHLVLQKIETGEKWAITTFPKTHQVGGPAWSPDSKKIIFSLAVYEAVDIWQVNRDGSQLKRLTKDGASNAPVYSPDGNKIAFSSGRQDPYFWTIWLMNADGSSQFSVSRNNGYSPSWLVWPEAVTSATTGLTDDPTPVPTIPIPVPTVTETIAEQPIAALPTATQIPTEEPTPRPTQPPATATPEAAKISEPGDEVSVDEFVDENEILEDTEPIQPVPTAVTEDSSEAAPATEEDYAEFEEYADDDDVVLTEEKSTTNSALPENVITLKPTVDFHFAKDLIKTSSLPELNALAKQIDSYPDSPLIVQGQIRGPQWLPMLKTLSRARANSVLRHLIVNENIKQINVTAIGEKDDFPDLSDQTEDVPVLLIIIN